MSTTGQARHAAQDPHSEEAVDVQDSASLERWSRALAVPGETLKSAVAAVGTRVDRIKDYLTGGMAADQEDA